MNDRIMPPPDFSLKILSVNEDQTSAVVLMKCGQVTFEFSIKLTKLFDMVRVKDLGVGMKMLLEATPVYEDIIPYEDEIWLAINQSLLTYLEGDA